MNAGPSRLVLDRRGLYKSMCLRFRLWILHYLVVQLKQFPCSVSTNQLLQECPISISRPLHERLGLLGLAPRVIFFRLRVFLSIYRYICGTSACCSTACFRDLFVLGLLI